MNKIILIGRLTKDPDLRYTTNGTAVCSFTLAVDRRLKREGEQSTDFINIVVWNKQGENCANYLSKGKMAAVEGRLQIRSYAADDGQKRYVTEVAAQSVQFLERATVMSEANGIVQASMRGSAYESLEEVEVDEECPF